MCKAEEDLTSVFQHCYKFFFVAVWWNFYFNCYATEALAEATQDNMEACSMQDFQIKLKKTLPGIVYIC